MYDNNENSVQPAYPQGLIRSLVIRLYILANAIVLSANNESSNPLRKHAYSNILTVLPLKNENFQIKSSDIFHISAQNIDCGYSLEPPRRGGSNEYPQSMFRAEIRKITYTSVNPSFTI